MNYVVMIAFYPYPDHPNTSRHQGVMFDTRPFRLSDIVFSRGTEEEKWLQSWRCSGMGEQSGNGLSENGADLNYSRFIYRENDDRTGEPTFHEEIIMKQT